MKLIACMPVRNEDWVLGLSLRVALMWCDEVVVLLHSCEDGSHDIASEIAAEYAPRVRVMAVNHPQWDEMQHRQWMLERARERGATHIAIIDADEILTGNLIAINSLMQGVTLMDKHLSIGPGSILQIPLYNLRNGIEQYHSNGIWGNRIVSLAFAYEPCLGWHGDKFHSREPECFLRPNDKPKPYLPIQQGHGGVMHLWGASERRLRAKHCWYKLTERLRWPDKPVQKIDDLYSLAIKPREPWTFAPVPTEWWKPYEHLMKYLDVGGASGMQVPWQEAECRRLVAEHGRERFAGLDLFGVV